MVTMAGCPVECNWMADQVFASGVQVKVAACWGVNFGASPGSLVHSGSMGPMRILSPLGRNWRIGALSENEISMLQKIPAASRQRNVGGVMPGGNTEPSSG